MNERFYDDSSRALGMSHGSSVRFRSIAAWKADTDAEHEAQLRAIGIACDEHGRPQVQHIVPNNAGAYDDLAEMIAEGVPWKAALDYLEERWSQESYEDRPLLRAVCLDTEEANNTGEGFAFFVDLMKAPVSPDKHSSRSRGKKPTRTAPDPLQAAIVAVYGRVA